MSGASRKILAEETLKGGEVFDNYAKRVTGNENEEAMKKEEFPIKEGK